MPCDLGLIIDNSIKLLELKAEEKGVVLKVDSFSDAITKNVISDPTRLGQVFINLISNAVKFTETGTVSFSCNLVEEKKSSQLLKFSVKDTGIGIKKDHLAHIFDSFSQADETTARNFGQAGPQGEYVCCDTPLLFFVFSVHSLPHSHAIHT